MDCSQRDILSFHFHINLNKNIPIIFIKNSDKFTLFLESDIECLFNINFSKGRIGIFHIFFGIDLHVLLLLRIYDKLNIISSLVCEDRHGEVVLFFLAVWNGQVPFEFKILLRLQMRDKTLKFFKVVDRFLCFELFIHPGIEFIIDLLFCGLSLYLSKVFLVNVILRNLKFTRKGLMVLENTRMILMLLNFNIVFRVLGLNCAWMEEKNDKEWY